jgi:hypothetical protein
MTLLADVVTASRDVADTSSRSRKVAILAELLRRLEPDEVPLAVGFLAGVLRQGRVGVGYSTIYGIECAPAAEACLTVDELDRAIADVQETTGTGSAARRKQILGELLGRATKPEADFVKRLFTGELRQGALAGLMIDAIAKAAGVSGEIARRALMLSGDLTRTAEIAMTTGEEGLREVGCGCASCYSGCGTASRRQNPQHPRTPTTRATVDSQFVSDPRLRRPGFRPRGTGASDVPGDPVSRTVPSRTEQPPSDAPENGRRRRWSAFREQVSKFGAVPVAAL